MSGAEGGGQVAVESAEKLRGWCSCSSRTAATRTVVSKKRFTESSCDSLAWLFRDEELAVYAPRGADELFHSRTRPRWGAPCERPHMPCFFRSPAAPRTGRRTIRSSELSNSSESPAASCNSSLYRLGQHDASSFVYGQSGIHNGILPCHLPLRITGIRCRTCAIRPTWRRTLAHGNSTKS